MLIRISQTIRHSAVNRVYSAGPDQFLISFEAYALSDSELQSIRDADAEWDAEPG